MIVLLTLYLRAGERRTVRLLAIEQSRGVLVPVHRVQKRNLLSKTHKRGKLQGQRS
jgi:hypothetical protein